MQHFAQEPEAGAEDRLVEFLRRIEPRLGEQIAGQVFEDEAVVGTSASRARIT